MTAYGRCANNKARAPSVVCCSMERSGVFPSFLPARNLNLFVCVSLLRAFCKRPLPFLLQFRRPYKRGSMTISRIIVCLFLTLPLAMLGQNAIAPPTADAAADQAKTPKLDHFDPNLVDKTLNPCDDFYQYSCNKWIASNPITSNCRCCGRPGQNSQTRSLRPKSGRQNAEPLR